MAITIDQINAELQAQPELKTAIIGSLKNDFLEGIKAEGVSIRTKDEETEFLSNYEKNVIPTKVQAEIGQKIKEVHDKYDADLLELLGEKKLPTEKTYDFMKRKLTEMKASKAKGNDDPVLADQIKEMTEKLKQYENYVAPEEVEKIKGKYFSDHVSLRLANSLDKKPIAVPAHITDEKAKQQFIETQRRFIKQDFLSRFTAKQDDQGHIVYYDGDKLLTDAKSAAPLTEEKLIEQHYTGYFVPEKKVVTGAGSGKTDPKEVDTNEANLKTKDQVHAYLKTKFEPKGISIGNPEYTKEYSRIIKDYAIVE